MRARGITFIVLAGGRSSRFGRDKLHELIDGRPLLEHAVDAGRPLASQIVVVVAPDAMPPLLPEGVEIVRDAAPFEGPLAGVAVGLAAAREPIVVVVGGDMPTLLPAVLERLVAELADPTVDVVALEHDGRPRPLPIAVRRVRVLAHAERLVEAGERHLGALLDGAAVRVIPESTWRTHDPDGLTLRDIDTPADL